MIYLDCIQDMAVLNNEAGKMVELELGMGLRLGQSRGLGF